MTRSSSNPFELETGAYRVLINDEGQHSLWPDSLVIPDGWSPVFGPEVRDRCLGFIASSWTDLRPTSLVRERP